MHPRKLFDTKIPTSISRKRKREEPKLEEKKEIKLALPSFIVHSIFGYNNIERPRLRNKSSSLNLNEIYSELEPQLKLVEKLLLNIVKGNINVAEAIIKDHPDLLLISGTVIDGSNRTHEDRTALQLSLGAEDTQMARMIIQYLRNFPDGEVIINEQVNGQFPEGYKEKEQHSMQKDLAAVEEVIGVIKRARHKSCQQALEIDQAIQCRLSTDHQLKNIVNSILKADSDRGFHLGFNKLKRYVLKNLGIKSTLCVLKAIYQYRNYLEPKENIKTGKHFNLKMLIRAHIRATQNYDSLRGFNSFKNRLIWRHVIGYTQRFLPALLAGMTSQGVQSTIELRKGLNREYCFDFFPLDRDPNDRLGYDYAINFAGNQRSMETSSCSYHCYYYLSCYQLIIEQEMNNIILSYPNRQMSYRP